MKKILLGLVCMAMVIGWQFSSSKVSLANSWETQQEIGLATEKFSEDTNKEATEKPVDSKTESTKKKYK